jgi:hypothetical protein
MAQSPFFLRHTVRAVSAFNGTMVVRSESDTQCRRHRSLCPAVHSEPGPCVAAVVSTMSASGPAARPTHALINARPVRDAVFGSNFVSPE